MRDTKFFNDHVAKLRQKLGSAYQGMISYSFLRAEVEFTDGVGIYSFDFKASKGSKSVTEQLLSDNDLFTVLNVRPYIGVRDTANPVLCVKQTYPNSVVFGDETTATPAGTFNPLHLEALYNAGKMSYQKGDTTYFPAIPLYDARFVPITQQTTAANKSATDSTPGINMPRAFRISGVDQGVLEINVPGAQNLKWQYSTAANTGKKVVIILELHGILASGGSKILTTTGVALGAGMD